MKKAEKDNLCISCYSERKPLVKSLKDPGLNKCTRCSSFFKGETKIKSKQDLNSTVQKCIKPSPEYSIVKTETSIQEEKSQLKALAIVTAELEGQKIQQEFEIEFKVQKHLCKECSRKAGKYYEGTLQIRNASDEIKGFAQSLVSKSGVLVCSKKEVESGIDYKLGDSRKINQVAEKLHNAFGGSLERSEKLFSWDRQTSKKVHRISVVYKAPEVKKGEAFIFWGKPVQVVSIGKKIKLLNLKQGKTFSGWPKKQDAAEIKKAAVLQAKPSIKILGKDFQPEELIDKTGKKLGKEAEYIAFNGRNYRVDETLHSA